MTISTQDCKDFIAKNSKIFNLQKEEQFKRLKKYNGDYLGQKAVFRDFQSQIGRVITLAELNNKLFLHSTYFEEQENSTELQEYIGMKQFDVTPTAKHAIEFLIDALKNDPNIIEDKEVYQTALEKSAWNVKAFKTKQHTVIDEDDFYADTEEEEEFDDTEDQISDFNPLIYPYFEGEIDNFVYFNIKDNKFYKKEMEYIGAPYCDWYQQPELGTVTKYYIFNLFDYESEYRFTIYQTQDNRLFLGQIDGD